MTLTEAEAGVLAPIIRAAAREAVERSNWYHQMRDFASAEYWHNQAAFLGGICTKIGAGSPFAPGLDEGKADQATRRQANHSGNWC